MSQRSRETLGRTRALLLITVLLFGTFLLLLGAAEEPYHIDELRQTRPYGMSFSEIARHSFAQTQPPLDPWSNAALQNLIGVGDVQQRLLSVVWGTVSLLLVWKLLSRHLDHVSASVAVLILAMTPLWIETTAYARPYALPLVLMLAFLAFATRWLRQGGRWVMAATAVCAVLLPLSRTTEPLIFLAAVAVVLTVAVVKPEWSIGGESHAFDARKVALISLGTLAVVGGPIFLKIREASIQDFTTDGVLPSWEQAARLVTDLPQALAENIPAWPAAAALVTVALVSPAGRRLLQRWQFLVLSLVPVVFSLAFFFQTEPTQPFFGRYVYFWLIPFVLVIGASVHTALDRWSSSKLTSSLTLGLVAIIAVSAALGSFNALTTKTHADWKALSATIMEVSPEPATVLFEHPRRFDAYRTPFAGRPRYLPTDYAAPSVRGILRNPDLVPEGQEVFIATLTRHRTPDGWRSIPAGNAFQLHIPSSPLRGPEGAARTLQAFSGVYAPENGVMMALASAKLYDQVGMPDTGQALVGRTVAKLSPADAEMIAGLIETHEIPAPTDLQEPGE